MQHWTGNDPANDKSIIYLVNDEYKIGGSGENDIILKARDCPRHLATLQRDFIRSIVDIINVCSGFDTFVGHTDEMKRVTTRMRMENKQIVFFEKWKVAFLYIELKANK